MSKLPNKNFDTRHNTELPNAIPPLPSLNRITIAIKMIINNSRNRSLTSGRGLRPIILSRRVNFDAFNSLNIKILTKKDFQRIELKGIILEIIFKMNVFKIKIIFEKVGL